MNDADDFFVEDESMDDLQTGWARGEPGTTIGSRVLDQRSMSIVERATARLGGMTEGILFGQTATEGLLVENNEFAASTFRTNDPALNLR